VDVTHRRSAGVDLPGRTYTDTLMKTADTVNGNLWGMAIVLDPTTEAQRSKFFA
jgi:hypothetical protein